MRMPFPVVTLVSLLSSLPAAAGAQSPARPQLLPREREVALALSAAPPHLAGGATVYAVERRGYVKVREGSNGFTCLVVRDHPEDLAPVCHDPEGTRTVVPRLLREAELRAAGRSEAEIRAQINEGLRTGKYYLPRRVGLAYMLSTEGRAAAPELGRVIALSPHVMIPAPFLRNEDIGALPLHESLPGHPVIISEGEFNAYIVMPVPEQDRAIPPVTPDPVLDALAVRSENDLPPPLPQEREIALALSAAPQHVAERATVYVLRRGGYVKVRDGANGFSCLVTRGHPLSLYPICHDPEGSETVLPVSLRAAELREQGRSREEVDREIAEGFRRGRFRAPRRVGLAYMLSAEGRFESPDGGMTGWPPHVMFYAPYVREADVGAIEEQGVVRRLPVMAGAGEPHGYIIVNLGDGAATGVPDRRR